jgi:hypothetical protein
MTARAVFANCRQEGSFYSGLQTCLFGRPFGLKDGSARYEAKGSNEA